MPKRTFFTNITPLPSEISRELAIATLHHHSGIIELNPLVIDHQPVKTPRDAPADEFFVCRWEQLTERVHYLPGGVAKGKVNYNVSFHNLPNGLQTHSYGPMSVEVREKWTICGSLPGEPKEPIELGLKTPSIGLYIREDVELKCKGLHAKAIRANLDRSHRTLVERMVEHARRIQKHESITRMAVNTPPLSEVDSIPTPRPLASSQTWPLPLAASRPRPLTFASPQTPSQVKSPLDTPIHNSFVIDEPAPHQLMLDNQPLHLRDIHPAFREDYMDSAYFSVNRDSIRSEASTYQHVNQQQIQFYVDQLAEYRKGHHDSVKELEGSPTLDIEPSPMDSVSVVSCDWGDEDEDAEGYEDDDTDADFESLISRWKDAGTHQHQENDSVVSRTEQEPMSARTDRSFDRDDDSKYSVLSDVSGLNSSRFAPANAVYSGHSAVSSMSQLR